MQIRPCHHGPEAPLHLAPVRSRRAFFSTASCSLPLLISVPPLCARASQILACDPRARRWTSWYHPDPAGEQIRALKYSLNKLIEGKTDVKSNAAVHTSQPSGSAADRRAPRAWITAAIAFLAHPPPPCTASPHLAQPRPVLHSSPPPHLPSPSSSHPAPFQCPQLEMNYGLYINHTGDWWKQQLPGMFLWIECALRPATEPLLSRPNSGMELTFLRLSALALRPSLAAQHLASSPDRPPPVSSIRHSHVYPSPWVLACVPCLPLAATFLCPSRWRPSSRA